jgi:hypothetical protein
MERSRINDKTIKYNEYLTQAELSRFSLSLKDKLTLFLFGYINIGTYKPEGFTAPEKFYLVRYKNRYFISYRQSWSGTFFIPEVLHNE